MYKPDPDARSMAQVQKIWDWYFAVVQAATTQDQHDYQLMQDLSLIDARPDGRSVWEITIGRNLSNTNGALHGGATALLFDMCTMSALGPLHHPGGWEFLGGVTRSLNVSYLRPVPVGTRVVVHSHVVYAGRRMALIRGELKSPDGNIVYATVEHHKVNVGMSEEMRRHEPSPKI